MPEKRKRPRLTAEQHAEIDRLTEALRVAENALKAAGYERWPVDEAQGQKEQLGAALFKQVFVIEGRKILSPRANVWAPRWYLAIIRARKHERVSFDPTDRRRATKACLESEELRASLLATLDLMVAGELGEVAGELAFGAILAKPAGVDLAQWYQIGTGRTLGQAPGVF